MADQNSSNDDPSEGEDSLGSNTKSSVGSDIHEAREVARDQEFERSLRSLFRTETPDPAMQQRIMNRLEREWTRLQRKRSVPSLSLD